MDINIFDQVSLIDVIICVLAVLGIWYGTYVKISNEHEVKNARPYSFSKYFKLYKNDGIFWLISGLLTLTFINEIGSYFLTTYVPGMPEGIEDTINYGWSALSGFIGYKVVKKFIP